MNLLKGIEYNSSTKGKYPNSKEIVSTGSPENCESEKWDTEVEKDKKVSFDNVTNVGHTRQQTRDAIQLVEEISTISIVIVH